ncbi:MAG: Rne/Rng family ribonuclease [Rickettsiales bacterium]|nr:Rne/Rng family ribonuclease [Rickettsiales bacterium]
MSRKMLVDAVHPEETRVVITDNKSSILEFDFTTAAKPQIKGNVYLAKVTRVEPSLQAAFVEYGGGKQGFLPFSEIHPNYYQIPTSDRERLIQEEEDEAAKDIADDEDDLAETEELEEDQVTNTLAAKADAEASVSSEVVTDGEVKADAEEKPKPRRRGRRKKSEIEADEKAKAEAQAATEAKPEDKATDKEAKAEGSAEEAKAEGAEGEGDDKTRRRRRRGGRNRGGRNNNNNRRNNKSDGEDGAEVEVLSGEDEIERPRRKRDYTRRYKIQEVIKRNQVLLVQVIKEERGNKGVSLTSFLSLAGRYCVLMPNSPRGGGVSRKINSGEDRKRLKKILSDMALPTGMSVIIRTAGAGHTRAEIKRDFEYLVKLWNQIREDTLVSSAPARVYEESNIVQRCIRDSYSSDIDDIIVDGEAIFKETKAFMKMLIPSHAPKVKLHKGEMPLFHEEGIDNQLSSMTEPEVRLRSGGSIVMNPTEALISIDVNSGRSTRERNVEETALKTNLEAAREVARQLRLRDLAGLIVIDFIDMNEGKNRRAVERAMKEALRPDRAKIQVARISTFGLMEMSRQRMRPSIAETIDRSCPHCQGTGTIRSEAALGIQIIRALEKEVSSGDFDRFRVSITASEALYILNNMRAELDKIENGYTCSVELVIDGTLHEGDFRIEKFRRKGSEKSNDRRPARSDDGEERPARSRRRGGRGRNRQDRDENKSNVETKTETDNTKENSDETVTEASEAAPSEAKTEEKPKRGRRGRKKVETEAKAEAEAETKVSDTVAPEVKPEAVAVEAEKPKRRGRPRKKVEATEETSEPKLVKPQEPPAVEVKVEEKPKAPKRSGWWQKIVE